MKQYKKSESFIKRSYNVFLDRNSGLGIWIVIIFLLLSTPLFSTGFLDTKHLLNVARKTSGLGIISIGQTFVILTGGIDLSNGMVITLVNVVSATLLNGNDDLIILVFIICLIIGFVVGLINGLCITKLRVPPFVCTLGMFTILKGICYVYTGGSPKGKVSPILKFIGSGFFAKIPIALFFLIFFSIISIIFLRNSTIGRYFYVVGANYRTAYLSGVKIDKIKLIAYILSGILAAISGLVLSGYVGTGSLSIGDGYNLNSVAATVVGGAAFSGGVGSVIGSVGGALFLTIVFSLLRFLGLSYSNQLVVQGTILAIAIYIQRRSD